MGENATALRYSWCYSGRHGGWQWRWCGRAAPLPPFVAPAWYAHSYSFIDIDRTFSCRVDTIDVGACVVGAAMQGSVRATVQIPRR